MDADRLIDAAIGRPRAQHLLERLRNDGLAVSIIAVADVYEGAVGSPDPQPTLNGLRVFLGDFAILPVTDPIEEQFARLRATLRRQGQRVPDMALLIAATAITEALALMTRNVRHFARLPDLQLYQPS